jgi:hypothetical protein
MKRKLKNALIVAIAAFSAPALAGDYKADPKAPAEKPGISKPGDISPPVAQAMVDDVNIGVAVAQDGRVPADTSPDDFMPGEDIYLTMDVSDAPAGTAIKVVWIGPGEKQIGTQARTVTAGTSTLRFVQQDTRGWTPGDYRAEVWVGDEKVNDEHFDIVSSRSARK